MSTEQDEKMERLLREGVPPVGTAPLEGIRIGARTRRRRRAAGLTGAVAVGLCAVAVAAVPGLFGVPGGHLAADEASQAGQADQAAKSTVTSGASWRVLDLPSSVTADALESLDDTRATQVYTQMAEEIAVVREGDELVMQDACLRIRVGHEPALPVPLREATQRGEAETRLVVKAKDLMPTASCYSGLGLLQQPLRSVDSVAVLRDGVLTYRAAGEPVLELERVD